jgi:transcriptional regulator with XRE-family HTH domain
MPPAPEHAPRIARAVTAEGSGPPKYLRVAAAVRDQVANGTLRPGQPAPSGAALSRLTGYSTLTCRKGLRALIAEGVLTPGPSRSARPRVAGPPQGAGQRDLVAASRVLSAALAAGRRANGLTQPELAERAGVSVTTVGHAETGRLWQSRHFWEQADAVLAADGELLRLHDAYRAAGTSQQREEEAQRIPEQRQRDSERAGSSAARGEPGGGQPPLLARVTVVWSDGSVTTVHPPETARPESARPESARPETGAGPAQAEG